MTHTFNLPKLNTLSKSMLAISLLMSVSAVASQAQAASQEKETYSSVTFFGDSLTDGGYFKPVTKSRGVQGAGQFTTNPDPSWATPFAEKLGHKAVANTRTSNGGQTLDGNNYAIGGALAEEDTSQLGMKILSSKNQLKNYMENKTVDPDGLYVVWVGANDIRGSDSNFNYDKPAAVNKIKTAAMSEIDVINTLSQAGAKYILVPNIPDLGLTPEAIEAQNKLVFPNENARENSTNAAKLYNKTLYDAAQNIDANIIPLDTFSLLDQITQNPSAYGFVNVVDKACGDTSSLLCVDGKLVSPDARNNYLFADDVHPTGRTHRMMADYANAVVTSPTQIGVLPHIATQSALATTDRLQTHINQLQNPNSAQRRTGPSVWASADYSDLEVAGFESDSKVQLLLGMDFAYSGSPYAVTGIYGNISQSDLDKGVRTGVSEVDLDELGFGVYHRNQISGVQLNGALGYGSMDMEINRRVSLDDYTQDFKSDADAKRYYAAFQAGYPMQMNTTKITPYLGATFNRIKLDTIREKENTGIAMQFDEQKYNTTYGTLGVKVISSLTNTLNVFGDVHYQKQLDDNREEVTARLNTQLDVPFSTPMTDIDDDSFGVTLGLSHQFGLVNANAGLSHTSGDDDKATSLFVGLSSTF